MIVLIYTKQPFRNDGDDADADENKAMEAAAPHVDVCVPGPLHVMFYQS